jgi:hypothetical protein
MPIANGPGPVLASVPIFVLRAGKSMERKMAGKERRCGHRTAQYHDTMLRKRLRAGLRRVPRGECQLMAIPRDGWMLLDQFANVHCEPTRSAIKGCPAGP